MRCCCLTAITRYRRPRAIACTTCGRFPATRGSSFRTKIRSTSGFTMRPSPTREPEHKEGSMPSISRRAFVAGMGATAAFAMRPLSAADSDTFKISVLSDEISQDFSRALEVAAREFGLGYVDLREINKKNIMSWDAKELAEARRLLEKFHV